MSRSRVAEIIRQFPQNGLKLLLEDPRNVRELLAIARVSVLDLIDFDRANLLPTTLIQRDFRHLEADVVLRAPLLSAGKGRSRRQVTIYILIEHQSEPDPLMIFRVLEYVVQIYKSQTRDWHRRHASFAGSRLHPVFPVVFYTGSRRWDTLGRMLDLVDLGEKFADVIPAFNPLFLNLSAVAAGRLESPDGFFAWVLRLVQERHARPAEFEEVLLKVVVHLEEMPAAQRLRWLELLSYVHALVYHERNRSERGGLQQKIQASVATDEHRTEVSIMGRTIADMLRDEGRQEGSLTARRQVLLDQLRERFDDVPRRTVKIVQAAASTEQLDTWLRRVVTAKVLDEVGIE